MKTLTKRKMSIGISQKIDNIIFEWYTERGMEVPKWKYTKDPEWWIEYLQEIENNHIQKQLKNKKKVYIK